MGHWALAPLPNPQSPIPNPQSPIPNPQKVKSIKIIKKLIILNNLGLKNKIYKSKIIKNG
jgi:hypothetical protein